MSLIERAAYRSKWRRSLIEAFLFDGKSFDEANMVAKSFKAKMMCEKRKPVADAYDELCT
jgi:hypothetical protein